MSDFFIYNQQVQVDGYDQAVFYCDPCDTPVNGREDPVNLGDSNVQTKWLDYSRNGFFVKTLVILSLFMAYLDLTIGCALDSQFHRFQCFLAGIRSGSRAPSRFLAIPS